ncbi:hypothetical protein DAPPUDRAFT_324424 [Daphnia pulex]|uniref:Uncharacterized protein n=1 Tax=Daphnia pulex TaxID=6669 RepID=E9H1E5_DAPPU|nr:hypothetical protein DAPPUDRAFT_324424 [Daphnia pulex]|eukprot:EFX74429.1 hypothetical protein DAPPUDRAFT_324424 [Daphnia pulex]
MKFLIISFFLACASAQWVAPYYSQWSPYNAQFTNDLLSKSVDLNKDGQPDVPVYTAAPALLPNYYPFAGLNYRAGFPYTYGAPFTFPFVQAAAAPAAEVKSTRSKRQVAVLPHNPAEFLNDFRYKSVDLNQDVHCPSCSHRSCPIRHSLPWIYWILPSTLPILQRILLT